MNAAQTIPLAEGWGMHDGNIGAGWWIVMVTMMVLFMGGMMWMMMRWMRGASSPDSPASSDRPGATESPMEILERRLAEGSISIDEYRERREVLVNRTAEPSGDQREEPLS